MILDPTSATPLYVQLMELLKRQIITGERAPGERLPTEAELAKQFGVSIITVRSAVGGLCNQGTFVKKLKHTWDTRRLDGFSDSCLRQGVQPGGRMLENRQVELSNRIAASLSQPAGSQGIYISRLRFADEVPVAIEKNYFPMRYALLLRQRFDNNSLFQYLREQEGVSVARADKQIELCRAAAEETLLLQVETGVPLLFVRSTTYTRTGEPLYVGTQIINGDRFALQLTQYADG